MKDYVSKGNDGDARTDLTVYRPSTGNWYVYQSADGFTSAQFGLPSDKPIEADYDGDGRHDIAIFRPSTGQWWILRSTQGLVGVQWGSAEDIPAPGDFDGDGKADLTVFRPSTGFWFAYRSLDSEASIVHYCNSGDFVIPAQY